jgi:MYXO-CTERM domain-containing protein
MSGILVAAVLSTMHYEGDVAAAGGDYQDVAIAVPAGTVEISIAHSDGSDYTILDWGVWGPDGYRGWGGGLSDDAIIGVEQSSRGYLPGAITPGTWTVVIGKAKLDTGGGHYSIDVTCSDTATLPVLPKAAFTAPMLSTEHRWYRGDFHVHSTQSGDAGATFDEISALAKTQGLDFANISDHNTVAQHALLSAIQPAHPDLLFLRGAEITTYGGHGNAVGISSYVDHRIGYNGRTIANVIDDVNAQGGVFIVNHPVLDLGTACIGCEWAHVDDTPWDQVTGLEVLTGNFDIGINAFYPRALALWDKELDAGNKIAAIGGSDDHTAGMNESSTGSPIGEPTTLVLADNLSEAAIIDALKHGRTQVDLQGPGAPAVDFNYTQHDGTLAEIGDDVTENVTNFQFPVHVTGGNGTFVQIWIDGQKAEQVPITSDDFTTTFRENPTGLAQRFRVQVINDINQPIVVTSHIYVTGVLPEDCSCRSTTPVSGIVPLALVALGLRRRRRVT